VQHLQLDNLGQRQCPLDGASPINQPGIAAAYVVRAYEAQDEDELSLKVRLTY